MAGKTVKNSEETRSSLSKSCAAKLVSLFGVFLAAGISNASAESLCAGINTQTGLNRCASLEMEKADAELVHVYKRLMSELEPKKRQQLKASQRAWINFRDEYCEFIGLERDGGSMQGMTIADCRTYLIKEQTRKLTWQLNCRLAQEDCATVQN